MKRKNIVIIIILVIIIVFAGLFIYKQDFIKGITFHNAQEYISSFGHFAALIFIAISSVRTLLIFFPFFIMVVLGGSIFGPLYGFIYSMISVFISANIAFMISRYLGKDSVQKLLRGRAKNVNLKIEQHGFKIIFLMRISSIFPFDILNYMAGLTKVKYKHFIFATVLGGIPEIFSLTYLGENIKSPFSVNFIIAIILVIVTVAVPFIISKMKSKQEAE